MKIGHRPVILAAAAALLALPLASGPAAFVGTAQAQGASGGAGAAGGAGAGGGPGAAGGVGGVSGGVGVAGTHTSGNTTAEVASQKDPTTSGLDHAIDVVETTPADQNALDALNEAKLNQTSTTTTTTTTSSSSTGTTGGSVSFGQAMNNMAQDAKDALSAIFGGSSSSAQ